MAGKTLDIKDMVVEDQLGCRIAGYWIEWDKARQPKVAAWEELRRYIYATDTTTTTNSKLPWKNKTTVPKLCQIRDNLYANYMASMFPKRKWLMWEGNDADSEERSKKEAIVNYMTWVISQDQFKTEVSKLVLDYIDYGNCFVMPDWEDATQELEDKTQVGYVGPAPRRISPLDIVFNPTAPSFEKAPKIVRSLISMGEVKEMMTRLSTPDNQEAYEALYSYMRELRHSAHQHTGNIQTKDAYYAVDGFDSYQRYLQSDYVELLTFYGDLYDQVEDKFYRNHVITVVDRHKVLHKAPNPSFFGTAPIFHVGWRVRQDNLWAMGPLDNLVGMQYRIDHIENLKADVFDLVTFPPLKVKGYVEDFVWQPMEKIFIGDDGDVAMMAPPFQVLEANVELKNLQDTMEMMAGAPREAMGVRSPGEKTMYEVQRLENAAARLFTNKIHQFEEQFIERLLNSMLELGRRKVASTSVRIFDDELKFASFQQLTADDITGNGRLKPVAARHFAEKAERIQNLNTFFSSPVGQDQAVMVHFSGLETAKLFEDMLEIAEYKIVQPYVRLSEQADAARLQQSSQEQVQMEAQTPSGLSHDDVSGPQPAPPPGLPPEGLPQ